MPPAAQDDSQLYARSFTDVYDAWYARLDDPQDLVHAFERRCRPGALIIELGSGTGRLAAPLDRAGFVVHAVDVSLSMLRRSAPGPRLVAADMIHLPIRGGRADAMFIAYNTLFNLTSRARQQACFDEASRVLRPGGVFGVETFIAPPGAETSFGISVREHPDDSTAKLAIVSGPDPDAKDVIVGSHIEIGSATVCRPWRLVYQSPEMLDQQAIAADLAPIRRDADWAGAEYDPEGNRHVSWYERI